jgi:hypothetical protein
MSVWHFNLLSDTSEHPSIDSLSSDTLAKMSETPASELFVRQMHDQCWVKRWVRRFRIDVAFAMGLFLAAQTLGYVLLRLAITDLRATIRTDVIKVLEEKNITTLAPPTPAIYTMKGVLP